MKVINMSKNALLADEALLASTTLRRMVGLLGRKSLREGEGLIIRPCNSIHTWFMRFPIDVIFLDKRGRVIKLLPEVPAFRFSPLVWKSKMVVELPAGTINRSGTEVEDHVAFGS